MTTRSDLVTVILEDLDRPDFLDTNVATVNSWISRAEQRIQMELRTRKMVKSQVLSFAPNGAATVPTDYIAVKTLAYKDVDGVRKGTLEYISPEDTDDAFADPNAVPGTPRFYTVDGGSIRVLPALSSLSTSTITLYYYAKLAPLVGAGDTSWLLDDNFNLYMNACLQFAYGFTKEDSRAALKSQEVTADILVMNGVDEQAAMQKTRLITRSRNPLGRR